MACRDGDLCVRLHLLLSAAVSGGLGGESDSLFHKQYRMSVKPCVGSDFGWPNRPGAFNTRNLPRTGFGGG